jgi:mannosylglycoprotein endo-beta-mannosidase
LGDANTKFFHLRANAKRRKNFIPQLTAQGRVVTSHRDKEEELFRHYNTILGQYTPRERQLNLDSLNIPRHDLRELEAPFSEEEIKKAVMQTPNEKAPGPDGYTGLFYKIWILSNRICLQLCIKYHLRGQRWQLLNSANVTLLPKKTKPTSAADYRPISLMHSVAKLLSKILANRLAPHLATLIAPCQSTFIKGRSIQDNFQYVQGAVNHFHKTKTPMLFLKLDITKAFDSVHWEYLLDVMEKVGFGQRWRDIISILWGCTTSRILLNGIPGQPIRHRRGLRQGDPLSPMLFILAMDPLQRMFDKATQHGLLNPIGAASIKFRTSLYADDAALFVRPTVTDVNNVKELLNAFGDATGLKTNLQKSQMFPIRCTVEEVEPLIDTLQAAQGLFPCTYLGLPLHIGKIRRADEQVLIDKIGARLPGWKGRSLTRAGRLTLINSVLSSVPVYHMTSFTLSKWAIKRIDRIRRNFLWAGSEEARAGKCWVNWRKVCRPKKFGGLGILDLLAFNRALRIRWNWFRWVDQSKPWQGLNMQLTPARMALFRACTKITIGNGKLTHFWKDKWLDGQAPIDIAPDCFKFAWRKNQTLVVALEGRNWMRGLRRINTAVALRQFVDLWSKLCHINLTQSTDTIQWNFNASAQYTANSAYQVQFQGSIAETDWETIWKAKVKTKCKIFLWLLLQRRLPTTDRIIQRGNSANPLCTLCQNHQEKTLHMIAKCDYSKAIWQRMAMDGQFQLPQFQNVHRVLSWWESRFLIAGYEK